MGDWFSDHDDPADTYVGRDGVVGVMHICPVEIMAFFQLLPWLMVNLSSRLTFRRFIA